MLPTPFRILWLLALVCPSLGAAQPAAPPTFTVDAEIWMSPRSAERLLGLPSLREAVAMLQANEDRRLAIRHPRSEQGELWAAELRDWLVALGIPSAQIELETDTAVSEQLDLVIRP